MLNTDHTRIWFTTSLFHRIGINSWWWPPAWSGMLRTLFLPALTTYGGTVYYWIYLPICFSITLKSCIFYLMYDELMIDDCSLLFSLPPTLYRRREPDSFKGSHCCLPYKMSNTRAFVNLTSCVIITTFQLWSADFVVDDFHQMKPVRSRSTDNGAKPYISRLLENFGKAPLRTCNNNVYMSTHSIDPQRT